MFLPSRNFKNPLQRRWFNLLFVTTLRDQTSTLQWNFRRRQHSCRWLPQNLPWQLFFFKFRVASYEFSIHCDILDRRSCFRGLQTTHRTSFFHASSHTLNFSKICSFKFRGPFRVLNKFSPHFRGLPMLRAGPSLFWHFRKFTGGINAQNRKNPHNLKEKFQKIAKTLRI